MNTPRRWIVRLSRMGLLVAVFLIAPTTRARAQFIGYPGYGYGYPGYGYGYPAYGYAYPAYGYGYGLAGAGAGLAYGYPGYAYASPAFGYRYGYGAALNPAYPVYNPYLYSGYGNFNPLFGVGLTPLGVQSALAEAPLTRYSRGYGPRPWTSAPPGAPSAYRPR